MHHDNRDRSRGCHGSSSPYGIMSDDDIDIEPNEFFGVFLGAIAPRIGISELNVDVLPFRIPECTQSAPESIRKRVRR